MFDEAGEDLIFGVEVLRSRLTRHHSWDFGRKLPECERFSFSSRGFSVSAGAGALDVDGEGFEARRPDCASETRVSRAPPIIKTTSVQPHCLK